MNRELWDDAILLVGLLILGMSAVVFVGVLMWAWIN
jgi:hypothetical protein